MELFVFTFHNDGRVYRALSMLSPDEVSAQGLPAEAVLGEISALLPTMTPDQFEANEAFVQLLHETIRSHALQVPEWEVAARAQGTGVFLIVDGRAERGSDPISPEDIIGRFDLRRGEIVPESYQPNEPYRLLTDSGPIEVPLELEEFLIALIRQCAHNYIGDNSGRIKDDSSD